MKAQTISVIKNILEQKAKDAANDYRNSEAILIQKYGNDFYKLMTSWEKFKFNSLTKEMSDCYDLLDDFNEHNW